jgi:hypothetical protein
MLALYAVDPVELPDGRILISYILAWRILISGLHNKCWHDYLQPYFDIPGKLELNADCFGEFDCLLLEDLFT